MTHTHDMILSIVNAGREGDLIASARASGALCLTVVLARGTVTSEMLDMLGLENKKRSIVVMISRKETTPVIMEEQHRHFGMSKAGHGIIFNIPLKRRTKGTNVLFRLQDEHRQKAGLEPAKAQHAPRPEGEEETMEYDYELLYIIVKSGFADEAMEAAKASGASGGTIIHARGVGIHESAKIFGVAIEPEKDMLLVVAKRDIAEGILQSVVEKVGLNTPGQGIAFSLPVVNVMGIAHGTQGHPES